MSMRQTFAVLCAAAALAACTASPPPPKEVFYRLDPVSGVASGTQVIEGNLRLEPVRAQGILSERALLFSHSDNPNRLEQYRYHHWEKPPAQLIDEALLQTLQASGVAEQVVPADLRTPADYSLDGELLRLERVLGGEQDSVSVEILFRLKRYSTRELLLQKRYQQNVTVDDDNMSNVIGAMSQARQKIFMDFLTDLRRFHTGGKR